MKNKILKTLSIISLILSIVLLAFAIAGAILGCNYALILLIPAAGLFSASIIAPIKKLIASKKEKIIKEI